jgi:hypothetical protein
MSTSKWPFISILATVSLRNNSELFASEGYEFGGYLFAAEEMKEHGQFAGSKLNQIRERPISGPMSSGENSNGNQFSTSKYNSHIPKSTTDTGLPCYPSHLHSHDMPPSSIQRKRT